ncbi:hypothetical protein [Amycolatopsis suaedae]|uniref:Uncharacterized protein n=1 Tax=Amycolatopsis suaedae TaxID=2510978 RepID=A0A4Q7IZ52_9PSEU|nr:hypothetical protein [Amycolatopsis suaedae]RZQ59749.1 hypothetical protein EWH70_31975 [Amycolatopsis suaedae]
MRSFTDMIRAIARAPRGFNADGRPQGLGMAMAMEAARRDPSTQVEDYLRREARTGDRHASVSS